MSGRRFTLFVTHGALFNSPLKLPPLTYCQPAAEQRLWTANCYGEPRRIPGMLRRPIPIFVSYETKIGT